MPLSRVRYAPSPTGRMHVGNFRTALYNWLFARKNGGVFFMRIEDTDRARLVEGGVEGLIRTLTRMGIDIDEGPSLTEDGTIVEKGEFGPYVQSQRLGIYRNHVDILLEKGSAYPCFCTSERLDALRASQELAKQPTGYDRHCRNLDRAESKRRSEMEKHVVRFAMPQEGESRFDDVVRGEVSFQNKLVDDFVILKTDGYPTYHLASVVDDHLMKTSHVIRGEEWLSSVPKHMQLYQAFGWEAPTFAHLPLFLNADRSKLSKRQGDVAVEDYLDEGYLPEALINFVALLGWNPSDEKEIYTILELVETFDLSQVNSAGAVFNREKLDWLNGKYLRTLPPEEFARRARPFMTKAGILADMSDVELGKLLSLEQERVKTLGELPEAVRFLFTDELEYHRDALIWKKSNATVALERLHGLFELLGTIDEKDWNKVYLEEKIKALIHENHWENGDTLWPLRVALSGREQSPGPFEIAEVLGKMKVLRRLEAAERRLK